MTIAGAAIPQESASKVKWPTLRNLLTSSQKPGKPLAQAGLSATELASVRTALTSAVKGDACRGSRVEGCGALQSELLEAVQITSDGQKAAVLRGTSDCGSAGCPMWIVQIPRGGTLLLQSFGWGYVIMPTHQHGYFDIVTAEGKHEVSLTLWRFIGDRYQPFRCASVDAAPDDESTGGEKVLERPCPTSSH